MGSKYLHFLLQNIALETEIETASKQFRLAWLELVGQLCIWIIFLPLIIVKIHCVVDNFLAHFFGWFLNIHCLFHVVLYWIIEAKKRNPYWWGRRKGKLEKRTSEYKRYFCSYLPCSSGPFELSIIPSCFNREWNCFASSINLCKIVGLLRLAIFVKANTFSKFSMLLMIPLTISQCWV